VLTPEQTAEMLSLQAQLAYSAARDEIRCVCASASVGDGWRNTDSVHSCDWQLLGPALRYLELRGLIERHPTQPWVRVREEDAPVVDAGKVAA